MSENRNGPPTRVLIIDDDATTLQFFEQMLVEKGHTVDAALTVEAGLVAAGMHAPDAILLDLHLPVVDGLECLRALRSAPSGMAIPVGILTGDYCIDDSVVHELKALGATIWFKPIWEEDLHRIVAGLVSQPAGQRR